MHIGLSNIKVAFQSSGEYKDNVIIGVGINGWPSGKKYLIVYARINSRWIKGLNVGS